MSPYKPPGSTPDTVPTESGGASPQRKLDWITEALCVQDKKVAALQVALDSVRDEIKEGAKGETKRVERLAVIENDVSHIRDGITEIKGAQITEAALLSLQNQIQASIHAMQSELVAQITVARDKAAEDLRQHEERARSDRRWVIGLLVPTSLGVVGLVVGAIFAYLRLRG